MLKVWKILFLFVFLSAFFCGLAVESRASASKSPTEFTMRENAKYKAAPLDYTDTRDADWAKRGFIARVAKGDPEPLRIMNGAGGIVWDMNRYAYISGDISKPGQFPDMVNPSLWRQAILHVNHGLYEVASCLIDGEECKIYQVRGYDVANMSFVETKNGFIVVDVLSYRESAAAAVRLLYDYLPPAKQSKKIHTIIYTHSHLDHYGGVLGVLEDSGKAAANVTITAPEEFIKATVSENVTAGGAMSGRARWMYGIPLWLLPIPAAHGQLNNGLAVGSGGGTSGMVPPTKIIAQDGSDKFDDLEVRFIMAAHTEAPAEMVMFFPAYKSICLAEICNQTQHNILTPRGAEVRDTMAWSSALDAMKREWVDAGLADSAWGPHTWPRWGREPIAEYIGKQSRLYRYLHDQTLFLMNKGYDMKETAEVFEFPPELAKEWFNRGYYGTTVFNVKAVYQKYLGWFDNNPVSLWKLPDKNSAALYGKYLPQAGGSLLEAARLAYADGHYRWVVEVLDHVRLAPEEWGASVHTAAIELQADAFEQMAYSAESGIWRNYFLTGAWRNRNKEFQKFLDTPITATMGPDTVRNMDTQQIIDTLSTQINGATSASSFKGIILWNVDGDQYVTRMEDHVLWTRPLSEDKGVTPDTTITMTRNDLNSALLLADAETSWLDALLKNGSVKVDGNTNLLLNIASLTHIAPPPLPLPYDPEPPGPPVPPEEPGLVLYWKNDGTFEDMISGDSIIVCVAPNGWIISNLRIAKIGSTVFNEGYDHIEWNGLTFDIISNYLSYAVRTVDIVGAPDNEEQFMVSIEAKVQKGGQTKTVTGVIIAGENNGGGCNTGLVYATLVLAIMAVVIQGIIIRNEE